LIINVVDEIYINSLSLKLSQKLPKFRTAFLIKSIITVAHDLFFQYDAGGAGDLCFRSIIKDEIPVGHPANGVTKAPAGKGFVTRRKHLPCPNAGKLGLQRPFSAISFTSETSS